MNFIYRKIPLFILGSLLLACTSAPEKSPETPVSGAIAISADESFYPIVKAEVNAFQNLYDSARIDALYLPEDETVAALLNSKVEMIIIGRELNAKEQEYIKSKNTSARVNKIATDAIAFIVNESFPDSLITTAALEKIFKGQVKKWNELAPHLPATTIEIIVDKSSSSNLSFLSHTAGLDPAAVKIYAAGTNGEVLTHVKKSASSLGIIGFNWISDEDDPDLKLKLERVRVLSVGKGDKTDTTRYYQPLQATLAEGVYPYPRAIYTINKNTKAGLGAGFASYIFSDPGQRVILKAGLLPAAMPGREIQVKTK